MLPVRAATDGASNFIRSVLATIQCEAAKANEPNEGVTLVLYDAASRLCVLTLRRGESGMATNETRHATGAILQKFSFTGLSGV